ncbi:unnamed protein product [Closterium sp. NIES-54]
MVVPQMHGSCISFLFPELFLPTLYAFLYASARSLPSPLRSGMVYNYLIGTVPALASQLRSLDVRGNFLTDVPAINYTFCGCAGNCMVTPSKCISGGTAQRPAAQCAICGTTNGVGPFCWGAGGECVADVMALWDVGVVNSPTRPVQPSVCMGGSVQAMVNSAGEPWPLHWTSFETSPACALLELRCCLLCSLRLFFPILPSGTLPSPSCPRGTILPFSSTPPHTPPARPVLPLAHPPLPCCFPPHSQLQYNWLYGSVPTSLFTLKLLSVLDLSYNYLTGSFPATTSLASLDIRSNFFYAVGSMTLQSCAALSNCLATPASCSSAGTTQRPTADCAICGSTNGQPPFCGGTGTCSPDSGPAAAQGTPNLAGSPLLPMVCSGIAIDAADATVLLALKSSLGVTLNNWNAAALCTLEGQTLLPAQWGGVRCTGAGKVTSIGLFSNYLTGTVPIPSKSLLALDVGFNFLSGVFPTLPLMFCAGENNCFVNSTNCRTYGSVQRPAGACAICGTAAGQGDLCFGGSCAPSSTAAISAGTVNSPNQPILPMACSGQCVPHTAGCVSHPFPLSDILPFRTGLNIHITLPIAPPPAPASLTLLMPPAMPHLTLSLSPLLPNSPVADNSAAPMDTGSALGVTFTSWLAASPCAIANSSITVAGTWTGVLCSSAGDVLSMSVPPAPACHISYSTAVFNAVFRRPVKERAARQPGELRLILLQPPGAPAAVSATALILHVPPLVLPSPHPCCAPTHAVPLLGLLQHTPPCVSLPAHSLALHATVLLQHVHCIQLHIVTCIRFPFLVSPQASQQQLVRRLPASDSHVSSGTHSAGCACKRTDRVAARHIIGAALAPPARQLPCWQLHSGRPHRVRRQPQLHDQRRRLQRHQHHAEGRCCLCHLRQCSSARAAVLGRHVPAQRHLHHRPP